MLLVERKAIPREGGWLYEIKFDGYRVLASTGSTARLKSRGGIDATLWFPELAAAISEMPGGSILDKDRFCTHASLLGNSGLCCYDQYAACHCIRPR